MKSMLSRTESTGRVSESCTVAQDQERELIAHRYGVSVAREYNYYLACKVSLVVTIEAVFRCVGPCRSACPPFVLSVPRRRTFSWHSHDPPGLFFAFTACNLLLAKFDTGSTLSLRANML